MKAKDEEGEADVNESPTKKLQMQLILSLINNETFKEPKPDEDIQEAKKKRTLSLLGPSSPMREALINNRKTIIPFQHYHNKVYFKTIENKIQM